jgi:predicted ester cyclase
MEPFVAVMRRYIEDYVNPHDTGVCEEIMTPEYVVHIGGRHLAGRDDRYIPAAAANFVNFPDLHLVVHEVVTNGDRFAFRFTEIGTHLDGAACRWAGIGVYRWDGTRLVENYVEQDHLSRKRQLDGDGPDPVEEVDPDAWSTRAEPASAATEAAVRAWIDQGDLTAVAGRDAAVIDDSWFHGPWRCPLSVERVEVDDFFTAGSRAAAHVRLVGTAEAGAPGELNVALIAAVDGDQVVRVHAVTDRIDLANRLAGLAG